MQEPALRQTSYGDKSFWLCCPSYAALALSVAKQGALART